MAQLIVKNIPFADGPLLEGQAKIEWLQNGVDCLSGAAFKGGHDGPLNRYPYQIFLNTKALAENDVKITNAFNIMDTRLTDVEHNLGVISSGDIVETINDMADRVTGMEVTLDVTTNDIIYLNNVADSVQSNLGEYDPTQDNTFRTVRKDLVFLKKEMGNYPGFDYNGNTVPEAPAGGMKKRIIVNSEAINAHDRRITALEKNWADSNVGSLTIKVDALRSELGPTPTTPGTPNVYERLDILSRDIKSHNTETDKIKSAIDFSNETTIAVRVKDLEVRTNQIDQQVNGDRGVTSRVTSIERVLGSAPMARPVTDEVIRLGTAVDNLNTVVGESQSEGLQYAVITLNSKVGIGQTTPTPDSILGRLDTLSGTVDIHSGEIGTLKGIVGDQSSQTGLVPAVSAIAIDLYGPDDVSGIKKDVADLKSQKFEDAPVDGLYYVRTQGSWQQVPKAVIRTALVAPFDQTVTDEWAALDMAATSVLTARSIERTGNNFVIGDKGAFEMAVEIKIDAAHADKVFELQFMINGTKTVDVIDSIIDSRGAKMLSGKALLQIEKSDTVTVNIKSADNPGDITVESLTVAITPL